MRDEEESNIDTFSSLIPPPLTLPFVTRLRVRFGDTDPAGLVYYPNIFHYFHIAFEEYFAARCGIAYHKLMADERLGFPTVSVKTEFFIPLVYGDDADISVMVSSVGQSSATFEYDIKRASDQSVTVHSTQIQVCMNLDTRRAISIPDKYREVFEG